MFEISHYAGPVGYEVEGFLIKNKDRLNDDLEELMHHSDNAFLNSVLYAADKCPSIQAKTAGKHRAGGGRAVSQGGKFKKQLDELMKTLKGCQSHYIRCIKPNSKKLPNLFEGLSALQQLRYSGVFEAVIIRKQGYPFRMLHADFYARYKALIPRSQRKVGAGRSASGADCQQLLSTIAVKPGMEIAANCQIGKTMVLWRATENRPLSLAFALVMQAAAVLIQKFYRRHAAKKEVVVMKALRKVLRAALQPPQTLDTIAAALKEAEVLRFQMKEHVECEAVHFKLVETKRLETLLAELTKRSTPGVSRQKKSRSE